MPEVREVIAYEWASLTYAAAFVLGLSIGVAVTIQVAKIVTRYIKNQQGEHDD